MAKYLEKILPAECQDWLKYSSNSVNILLTGNTGVGKSTLVNCIIGSQVAEEGDGLDPMTMLVKPFEIEVEGVCIKVWDSPGLQDGLDNEETYIADMKKKCKSYDLVLYCMDMKVARFPTNDNKEAMRKLTRAFGVNFWKHTVVALTFANQVETLLNLKEKTLLESKEAYKKKHKDFEERLHKFLVDSMSIESEVAKAVPVIPVGCIVAGKPESRQLPDCKDWLSTIWMVSILRMKENAQPAMLQANTDRIKTSETITEEDMQKPGPEQPIDGSIFAEVVKETTPPLAMVAIGAVIGSVAGPVGALAGAAVGAVAGAVTSVIRWFSR